jgi:cation diffusion facilitator family transporter
MSERWQRGRRVTLIGMGVNAALATVKFCAGLWGHSQALVADAVESFADIFSSLVVWGGLRVADEPPDPNHPYGHGKAEPLAAAIVSTFLLLAAAAIALKSLQEAWTAHQTPKAYTLVVLLVVVLIKETMFRWVVREAGTIQSSAVETDAWHHRSDAITSFAAAVGITIALVGGPGYASADDVAAIVAAGIIAWNGWRLLRPALDELMDAAPAAAVAAHIQQLAGRVEGVARVEKCRVRKMGYSYLVDMHVEVNPLLTVEQGHRIAHRVKDCVRQQMPRVSDVLVHVEPFTGKAD